MKDATIIQIVAMILIVVITLVAIVVLKVDGVLLSGVVGAIVFIVTREHYKPPTG